MTHPGRPVAGAIGVWFSRHTYVLPAVILLAGGIFRFFNLNWDNGHQLHPDERWIFMVVSGANGQPPLGFPTSWGQFFSASKAGGSPLDPHFFAYGSLPFYLLAAASNIVAFLGRHVPLLSTWAGVNSYDGLPMLGRGLSGMLELLSLMLLFVLGKRIYGYWTGILAMTLGAFTVQDIQLAHFYAVDTVLLPLVLLVVIGTVDIVQHRTKWTYLWTGIALGAALATKTTALLLVIPFAGAGLLEAWSRPAWPAGGGIWDRLWAHYRATGKRLNDNLIWVLAGLTAAAVTFMVAEPYAIIDRGQLISDITQQTTYLVTNDPPFSVPFTIQYAHTTPYLYQLKNILFWGMGIPLGLTAFGGVLWAVAHNLRRRPSVEELVLLLWIVPYFLFVGRFFAKFNRYMLPITPVMTLLGAASLVWLLRKFSGRFRLAPLAAITMVVAVSLLYSAAYMHIYAQQNTRVAASRWMFSHIPAGTSIATEGDWDDPLPIDEQGHSGAVYHESSVRLNLYNPDDRAKIAAITNVLTRAQYLVMSSERMIGSIPRLPDRYPLTVRYYHLLFANKLNFRLVRHFEAHPQLGPIAVQDYGADESFHVYDHPDVRIFKRVSDIAPARVAYLLTNRLPASPVTANLLTSAGKPAVTISADRRLLLSGSQWRADQHGQTLESMFPRQGFPMRHPIITWLLMLEILGAIAFPFTFVLFRGLLDRGTVLAKTMGLLLPGYLIWIAVSLGIATYDRGLILVVVVLGAALSAMLWIRKRREIGAFLRLRWRFVLAGEAVFLAAFVLFILLRMWYPDLGHQFSPVSATNAGDGRMGEKQMELAYLNAIVRSRVFPPFDPFFSHGFINYYYYGFYLVGTLCKLANIAPVVGFNLAIATLFAMLAANIFTVGLNLARRILPGLAAAFFVVAIGNLNGAWQVIDALASVSTLHSSVPVIGGILNLATGTFQVVANHQSLPPFDFWGPTRIIPPVGGPITEFPYFTYLFADLHPHLIAYPMTAAVLALAASYLRKQPRSRGSVAYGIFMGATLLGAIAVTNPWDFPTYLSVLALGLAVGLYARRHRWSAAVIWRPVVWTLCVSGGALILYLPFKLHYQTVFVTGIGLVRNISPDTLAGICPSQQTTCPQLMREAVLTPLRIYLEHFGLFLFVIVSYLTWLLLAPAGGRARLCEVGTFLSFAWYHRDRPRQVWHAHKVARRMLTPRPIVIDGTLFTGLLVLVGGLLVLQEMLLAFLCLVAGIIALLLLRLGRQLQATRLFVLLLLLVPLLISLGTQIFFVKDWLAGGSSFRMNTIFKFYNQAWVLFAVAAAASLSFLYRDSERSTRSQAARAPRSRPFRLRSGSVRSTGSGGWTGRRARTGMLFALEPVPGSAAFRPQLGSEGAPSPAEASAEPVNLETDRAESVVLRRLSIFQRWPAWTATLALLIAGSLIYTYAGTIARETYRSTWIADGKVPFTVDGMAFMKVTYPEDYRAIRWLNTHVRGAQIITEAGDSYYNWRSRVSTFTGLPTIFNGIHEAEQRFAAEIDPGGLCDQAPDPGACRLAHRPRDQDLKTLYDSPSVSLARRIIRAYGIRYIYVGFSERQLYSAAGLAKFQTMAGRELQIAFRTGRTTIYQVMG